MTATAVAPQTQCWQDQADEPQICVDGRIDPQVHDAYWQSVFWGESYYRRDCDFDDYAPAYCVGYIGYAQYGGAFEDAEKSLCANWLRIKGSSRLTVDEAMQAVRAAWTHAEHAERGEAANDAAEEEELIELAGTLANRSAPLRQGALATA